MKPGLMFFMMFGLIAPAFGQSIHPDAYGEYNGVRYRGRVCSNPHCSMCDEIMRKLYAMSAELYAREQVVVSTPVVDDDEFETIDVKETRWRTRKVCTPVYGPLGRRIGTNCTYVKEPYTVTVKKRVRKAPPKPVPEVPAIELQFETRLNPTPRDAIKSLIRRLNPTSRDVIIDAGSGDGRVIMEFSRAGCRSIGVELDPDKVAVARSSIKAAGSKAVVFQGDATTFDYSGATTVYMYQMPKLMRRIVPRIPAGRRIVSYNHPIPGVKSEKWEIDGYVFYVGTKGVTQKATTKGPTFGLE